jgi:hypothetical protein
MQGDESYPDWEARQFKGKRQLGNREADTGRKGEKDMGQGRQPAAHKGPGSTTWARIRRGRRERDRVAALFVLSPWDCCENLRKFR